MQESEPLVAARKPCLIHLTPGRTYYWCACGRSARQPFCDGSHRGTPFTPLAFTVDAGDEYLLCACKRTRRPPFCDGSHSSLSDRYGTPMDQAVSDAQTVSFSASATGACFCAELDNGCYVVRAKNTAPPCGDGFWLQQVIGSQNGARHLSQFTARVKAGMSSPILAFGDSEVAVFVVAGFGSIEIGDQTFSLEPLTGAYVRADEAVRLSAYDGAELAVNFTACPLKSTPRILDAMPDYFDAGLRRRISRVDPSQRSTMGDRFFQVLIDGETMDAGVTQFIGHIPRSRAAHHRHLYEEALTVLSGRGFMWTDATKAEIEPGDTIFLPRKQSHSVECTSAEGMMLVGVFYPAMSPAINY